MRSSNSTIFPMFRQKAGQVKHGVNPSRDSLNNACRANPSSRTCSPRIYPWDLDDHLTSRTHFNGLLKTDKSVALQDMLSLIFPPIRQKDGQVNRWVTPTLLFQYDLKDKG